MKEHQRERVARILRADQVRERHGNFFRRSEMMLAVEDHRVRAVEHENRGAGRLILALMHLQVGIFDVERQREPFALDGAGERGRDVEVESVTELVRARSAAGFNSRGEVARIMASEAGLAERAEQVTQRLEAEEVEALIGDFKFCLLLILSDLPADAGGARRIWLLVD